MSPQPQDEARRRPAAFRVEPPDAPAMRQKTERAPERPRAPQALSPAEATVVPAEIDVFSEPDPLTAAPPPALPARRRSLAASLFLGAAGLLVSLAVGLWVDDLIRTLFARLEWLGWTAAALAGIALVALAVIVGRELAGLARLAAVEKLRQRGEDAIARNDARLARSVVEEVMALLARRPETAAGRTLLAGLREEIVDGADLVRLAETELLARLDERATALVLDSAKRVSVVTAVSPRAIVDVAYVVFECARLIRRIADLYGGRPGTLGFLRLARSVIGHLAVTGSVAVGDSFVQQIVGHGLAARLSAKLGEGVVNGMMTARVGMAAIGVSRPLPFSARKQPGIGDFLSALTAFAGRKPAAAGKDGE